MSEETPVPNPEKPKDEVPPPIPPVPPKPVTLPAVVPVTPAVPAAAAPKPVGAPVSPERRQFVFTWLKLAWIAFAMATGAALSTVLRFMFPNVLFEPKTSFRAGRPEDYEVGKVDTRWMDKYGVWIVRTAEGLYVLSTVCTHLGCRPNWLETEQKFKCPCHGSGFYKTGINFEGPAPRPLERFRVSLADDGQIFIDKSKKFQQEKGEWNDSESFLTL
ncbi:MAG: ubiquinol-cytochrome c reductase iron-sulfur subunit [Candidatus Omnitrophica bacterium]|nr:ubiquinol-cytochrome c reductase iron-sulfur subunit [Candidatus Omnitrophota bacterium]